MGLMGSHLHRSFRVEGSLGGARGGQVPCFTRVSDLMTELLQEAELRRGVLQRHPEAQPVRPGACTESTGWPRTHKDHLSGKQTAERAADSVSIHSDGEQVVAEAMKGKRQGLGIQTLVANPTAAS